MSYKNELTKEVLLKRVFSDPKNYPYGFSRSGDFSISESKALVSDGALIAALVDGLILPETEEDQDIIAVAHGRIAPKTNAHRAWLKYQKRINRPKTGSIYGTRKSSNSQSSDHLVNDVDDDIDIGFDDDV